MTDQIKKIRLFIFALCFLPSVLFAQFTITSSVNDGTCSYDSTGSISISVTGGTTPYTYQWSSEGETNSSVTGLVSGTYSVTVTDNAGADTTVSYLVGPSPMVNDTTNNIITNKIKYPYCGDNGHIILNILGGNGNYQYAWNTGSSNFFVGDLSVGDYSVIVTDAKSCTANFSFSFAEVQCFIEPTPWFTPNGDGFNDTWTIKYADNFPNAKLIIFDRWGTKVYEHKGTYENWDGKSYLGVPAPDAVYYYFFYQDKDDKEKASRRGSVTIIR